MSQPNSPAQTRGGARSASTAPTLGKHRTRYVRDNIGILSQLTSFDRHEAFLAVQLPRELRSRIRELHEYDIIEIVGWVANDDRVEGDCARAEWTVNERARQGIDYWEQRIETYPCGHAATGFQNLRDGAYGCPRSDCDAEFERDVVVERFMD
jgi:hypothetical protein